MQPKISVLIAAYNVEKYINACLESVAKQTYPNFEVIIINDGSTDKTLEKCQTFCQTYPNFKVYTQVNRGLSAVRNVGIKKSTGEYLVFIDGDDFISVDYLQKLYENLSENRSDIAVCNYETFPKATKPINVPNINLSGREATTQLLTEQENYQIVSWNKLYRKSLFEDIQFPIRQVNEDSFTTFKILAEAKKVSFMSDRLYFYRQREQSIMSSIKLNQRLSFKMAAALEAKKYFNPKSNLYKAAEISELLAYFAFLDNISSGKLKTKPAFIHTWLKDNRSRLFKNPYLTLKLRTYIILATFSKGQLYQFFRRIKH